MVLVIMIELTCNEQSPLVMNKGRGDKNTHLGKFKTPPPCLGLR